MESIFLINLEYNIWQHSVLFQRSPSSLSTEVLHTPQKPDLKHQRGELILRSCHSKVFCKRGVLGNFAKFKTLAQVFSCELCKISKNTFAFRTSLVAASDSCWWVWNKKFFLLTLFKMGKGWGGGGAKRPPTSFSLGISPQNFQSLRLYLVPVINCWNWTKTTPQKTCFFQIKSLQNWGYNNFSHRNDRVTKLWSHNHIYNMIWVTWWNFVSDVIDINYDVINFISKYLYFKKA